MAYAALLQGILDDPDSDTPRLVMADWFEERGDPARAAFIRDQCELVRLSHRCARARILWRRNRASLAAHGERWLATVPEVPGLRIQGFRRGFPSIVFAADPADLPAALEALRLHTPVDTVCMAPEKVDRLKTAAYPGVEEVRVEEAYDLQPDTLERLLANPLFDHVRRLGLAGAGIENEGMRRLAASGRLARLEAIDLTNGFVGGEGFAALLEAGAPHLRAIDFGSYGSGYAADPFITDDSLLQLASTGLPELRVLGIDAGSVSSVGFRALLESTELPHLHHLTARYVGIDADAFHCAPGPIRLKSLEIEGIDLDGATVDIPQLSELVHIGLTGSGVTPELLSSLAKGPARETLESLGLASNTLEEDAIDAMAQGPWTQLYRLDLSRNRLGEHGAHSLARLDLPVLRHLDIAHNALGAGFRAFADAAWLPALEVLDASDNQLEGEALSALSDLGSPTSLNLSGNPLDATSIEVLAKLPLHALTDLWLSSVKLRDEGLEALARCRFPALMKLCLDGVGARPAALASLLEASLPRLRILDLQLNTALGDGDLPSMLKPLESLRELRVTRCGLDDATMMELLEGPVGERLFSLSAWGNRCSPDVWRRVQSFETRFGPTWMPDDPEPEVW